MFSQHWKHVLLKTRRGAPDVVEAHRVRGVLEDELPALNALVGPLDEGDPLRNIGGGAEGRGNDRVGHGLGPDLDAAPGVPRGEGRAGREQSCLFDKVAPPDC